MEPLPVRYRVNGAPLISVTQVLALAGRIESRWFTEEARVRGQAVHRLTERFDRGETLCYPDEYAGYLDAYASFCGVCRPVYADTEVAVASTVLRLGGRIDRVCARLFGEPALLDLKTGAPAPWHAWQLALYNLLRPTGARWTLHLRGNGTYKLLRHTDPADYTRARYDVATVRGTVYPEGDWWLPRAAMMTEDVT